MKRFFKLTLIIGITMIALAISNIAYADVDFDIFRANNIDTVIPVVFTSGQRIELSGASEVVMGQESIVTIYEES